MQTTTTTYVCCSDCVGVCGNVCCLAAVVKDWALNPRSVRSATDSCYLLRALYLLKNILNRFIKPEVVQKKEGGDLLTITINKDIILHNDKIGFGESTRGLLQKEISSFKNDASAEVEKN